MVYDLFHLPGKILPAVHGILVQLVEEHMNETTFRCYTHDVSQSDVGAIQASSLGQLIVYREVTQESEGSPILFLNEVINPIHYAIQVDHAHLSINEDRATIAWIQTCNSSSENVTIYLYNCADHNRDHSLVLVNPARDRHTFPSNIVTHGTIIDITAVDFEGHRCSMNESIHFHNQGNLCS